METDGRKAFRGEGAGWAGEKKRSSSGRPGGRDADRKETREENRRAGAVAVGGRRGTVARPWVFSLH